MSNLGTLVKARLDPLQLGAALPHSATYFPAGFPLQLSTNSLQVVEALDQCWGRYTWEFDRPPIRMQVLVADEGELSGTPVHRARGHLYSVVADPWNFGSADLRDLFCAIHISAQTASDYPLARWYYLESMAYLLLAQRYLVPVHSACIASAGSGLMLCGPSGAGKSTLAFACARAGWTFVTDDCTWLIPDTGDRMAIGRPHQARLRHDAARLFPELAGYLPNSHPNGKLSLEIPMDAYPRQARCPVDGLVFLERHAHVTPRLERIASEDAVETLLNDTAYYGEEVQARHEKAIRQFLKVPAYRMYYEALDDALRLLGEFRHSPSEPCE